MRSEYIKEFKLLDKDEEKKNRELLKNINIVKNNIQIMYNNMQFAESDLIDYYTYQIKAEQAKYDFLIRKAKKKDLKIDI